MFWPHKIGYKFYHLKQCGMRSKPATSDRWHIQTVFLRMTGNWSGVTHPSEPQTATELDRSRDPASRRRKMKTKRRSLLPSLGELKVDAASINLCESSRRNDIHRYLHDSPWRAASHRECLQQRKPSKTRDIPPTSLRRRIYADRLGADTGSCRIRHTRFLLRTPSHAYHYRPSPRRPQGPSVRIWAPSGLAILQVE